MVGNPDGNLYTFNSAFANLAGYSKEELMERGWFFLIPFEFREKLKETLVELETVGQPVHIEIEFTHKDGTRVPIKVFAHLSTDEDTQESSIYAFITDMTDQKQAEELIHRYIMELERSNQELQMFASTASHDLQSPLTSVVGFLGLLKRHVKDQLDEDSLDYIERALAGGVRMQNLISDLLKFARIEVNQDELRVVDCEGVLAEVLADLQPNITNNSATVTHDPLPPVRGMSSLLFQVFENLLSNALKFRGPENPVIHVGLAEDDSNWIFSVEDNGIGFDQADVGRLFIMFQRLHSQAEFPGTGIGLPICKKIVERLGGQIWAKGKLGEGATFFFTLPKLTNSDP
jgi:PAS domain S-box-containing protein